MLLDVHKLGACSGMLAAPEHSTAHVSVGTMPGLQ